MSVFTWTSKGCRPPSAKETLQMRQYLQKKKKEHNNLFLLLLATPARQQLCDKMSIFSHSTLAYPVWGQLAF